MRVAEETSILNGINELRYSTAAFASLWSPKRNLNQGNKGLSKLAKDCPEENLIILTAHSAHTCCEPVTAGALLLAYGTNLG